MATNIKKYIVNSEILLAKIDEKIQQILAEFTRLLVWGTGELAMKLLAETSFGRADIVAYVDNNAINQGRTLKGIPIISPKKIKEMPYPILVTTLLHQKEITEQIKSMGLPNKILFLN